MQSERIVLLADKKLRKQILELSNALGLSVSSLMKLCFKNYLAECRTKGILADHD